MVTREHLSPHRIEPELAEAPDGTAKLEQVFARLDGAITTAQVAMAIVEGGRAAGGANSGALVLLSPDRSELQVAYSIGADAAGAPRDRLLPVSARFPLADVVRSRHELWLTGPDELVQRYPSMRPTEGSRAWAALPLQIDRVTLGAVGWSFDRQWLSSYQRACLRSLAQAGGAALYRAGIFDRERAARMQAEVHSRDLVRQDRTILAVSSTLDAAAAQADTPSTLAQIARLTLPLMGEWCGIQLLDGDSRLRHTASVHLDSTKEQLLNGERWDAAGSAKKLPSSMNDGKPLLVQSMDSDSLRAAGFTPRQAQVLRSLGLKRILFVPIRIHDRTFGTLAFGTAGSSIEYSAADISLADRIERRCAAWLEYIELYKNADRAYQAREEFVAATSHELRTPLSHIKGFVSTLRTNEAAWDKDTRDDFLAEIEQEADRLTSLIANLLDLSRIDSGGLDPAQRMPTAPAALVNSGIDRLRPTLGDRPLEVQVAPDLPPVWADASQIERVLANLLDNAVKYSPADQPIGVIARVSRKAVMFRVEDRGLGIPPSHMDRIFEPFFREPTGSYPSKPGTGLGLAICRSIVQSQRGRIWAEPRPGGGTVIAFTLPTVAEPRGT